MITFEKWGEPPDVELYAILYNGDYIARLAIDFRPQFSNVVIFNNRVPFPIKVVNEVCMAIRQEFGEIEIRVAN